MTGAASSVVMYRVGGRAYPMKSVPQCKVCQSEFRFEIEDALLAGRTFAKIAEAVASWEVSARNVKDHFTNGHMPLETEVARRVLERRAQERGKSVDEGAESIVTGIGVAELVLQRGVEAIIDGSLRPDMKDVLAAAKFVEQYEAEVGGLDHDDVVAAFMEYHETAQRLMPPEMFAAFGESLAANPTLRALIAKQRGDEPEPEEIGAPADIVLSEAEFEELSGDVDNEEESQDSSISSDLPPEHEESIQL